jgi:hypothetical protein
MDTLFDIPAVASKGWLFSVLKDVEFKWASTVQYLSLQLCTIYKEPLY